MKESIEIYFFGSKLFEISYHCFLSDDMRLYISDAKNNNGDERDYEGEWQRRRIKLKSGTNVITWMVFNNRDIFSKNDVIAISKIDILGLILLRITIYIYIYM